MAAPFIGIYFFHQSGPYWISMDVSNRLQQVAVSIEKNRFVAPTKKLPITLAAAVVSLGEYPV